MTTAVKDAAGIREVVCGQERDQDVGGFFTIEVIRQGAHGPEVTDRITTHNLVVNTGKRQIPRLFAGLQANLFDQARIGTSGAAAGSGDTNVLSPVAGTLVTVDSLTLLAATRTLQIVVSYPSGVASISAASIQEIAILNQNTSPGGSAMARALFTPVSKTESDKLRISYTFRIT